MRVYVDIKEIKNNNIGDNFRYGFLFESEYKSGKWIDVFSFIFFDFL